MRKIVCMLCSALGLVTPAAAQVINGEGIYENSSAHTPPTVQPDLPPNGGAGTPSNPKASSTSHDPRARDRDD